MILDIGFITQPPQPDLQFFLGFALAYRFARTIAAMLLGIVLLAAFLDLDQVPAKTAFCRLTDVAWRQFVLPIANG